MDKLCCEFCNMKYSNIKKHQKRSKACKAKQEIYDLSEQYQLMEDDNLILSQDLKECEDKLKLCTDEIIELKGKYKDKVLELENRFKAGIQYVQDRCENKLQPVEDDNRRLNETIKMLKEKLSYIMECLECL